MGFLINHKYRIRRNAEYEKDMQALMDAKVFRSYRDILIISAIIGFNNEKKIPINKTASDGVQMQFFTEDDYDLMNLIAYADTKDKNIVNDNKKYEVFEQYSNAGFPLLLEHLEIINDGTEINRQKALIKYFELVISGDLGIKEILEF